MLGRVLVCENELFLQGYSQQKKKKKKTINGKHKKNGENQFSYNIFFSFKNNKKKK
jgi:hypothetical protein